MCALKSRSMVRYCRGAAWLPTLLYPTLKISAFRFSFSARRDLISLSNMPSFGWYCW